MEICNNCGEEIIQFTVSNATIEVTGGREIKIMRLGCRLCNHVQHTFASDNPITALSKRIEALEEQIKKANNVP